MKHLITVLLASAGLLGIAFASPAEDLLVAKLPGSYKKMAKVPQAPLVEATTRAVSADRGLAPQITAAAVRRAEDCSAIEAVVRAALRDLAPTPTSLEAYAIVQAAVGASSSSDTAVTNAQGDRVAAGNCTEGIVTTGAAEYPQYASVLFNESGKQLAGKALAGKEFAGKVGPAGAGVPPEPGIGAAPGIGPLGFPNTAVLPNPSGGIVRELCPVF
jgi:hypothetical protein